MSDFIDILSTRVPAVLCIAFYFSLLAIFFPRVMPRVFHAIESFFSRLAERKALALVAVFLIVIGVRPALLRYLPVPVPGIHDEFSYLLLGDTLAHGRLANPPQSHADQFRIVSCELVSDVFVEISACARSHPGPRPIAGTSLDRRAL